jgi:hypothetical protein
VTPESRTPLAVVFWSAVCYALLASGGAEETVAGGVAVAVGVLLAALADQRRGGAEA